MEAAFAIPLLAVILFGLAEFGLAWRSASNVATTAHAASLSLSRSADVREADFVALQRVRAELASGDEIRSVVIYRTDGTTGHPPPACRSVAAAVTSGTSGVSGLCNVYSGSYVSSMSITGHDDPACAGDVDGYLCPTSRRQDFGPADRIGIEISVRHEWITGFLPGGGRTIVDRGVAALDPEWDQ